MAKPVRLILATGVAALLASFVASGVSNAGGQELSSRMDYTLPQSRDKPVVCKEGDIEYFPGRSLAQVFGAEWPAQPVPQAGSERIRAQMKTSVQSRAIKRGLPAQRGLVVVAVLVGASGKPLQAKVLCATTPGFDRITRRMAMQSEYKPAVINGRPVTSVAVHVQKYGGGGA